jgi:hypothetical protein
MGVRTKLCAAIIAAWTPALAQESSPIPKEHREALTLWLDWTLGFGKTRAVDTVRPASLMTEPRPVLVDAQVGLSTFIVGAKYAFTEDIAAGFRLPFTFGNLGSISFQGGRAITLGNLELDGSVQKKLSDSLGITGALALALPTSLGTELPNTQAELDAKPPESFDNAEANKYSINQAAAAAFGYEQDQLFWSKRIGLVPSVEARWESERLHAAPLLKMVNLFDTHGASVERYRMEIVFGAAGGYRVLGWLDVGLRVWGSAAPVRRDDSPVGAGVVSPEVRAFFGQRKSSSFYVAGVLPFVGSTVDPYYFGALRAGLSGSF